MTGAADAVTVGRTIETASTIEERSPSMTASLRISIGWYRVGRRIGCALSDCQVAGRLAWQFSLSLYAWPDKPHLEENSISKKTVCGVSETFLFATQPARLIGKARAIRLTA
jgi:hypothetical protein